MAPSFLEAVDWTRPWLAHLAPIAAQVLAAADWRMAINERARGLRNHRGLPVQFVPQSELPAGTSYEAFISATGQVPTRNNLHDFFNALVWLTFPLIKCRLNALQAEEISKTSAEPGISAISARGKIRDATTIFDENASLLITSNGDLIRQLRNHQWRDVFVGQRSEFLRNVEVWPFGHALMEKLVSPYKAITSHAWILHVEPALLPSAREERIKVIDRLVTEQLSLDLSTSMFSPLPVLGVPGWWGGQDESFYQDEQVFRPKRQRAQK